MDGLREERFLILPHPEVAEYFQRKAGDYDRWLAGMRRLREAADRRWRGPTPNINRTLSATASNASRSGSARRA